MLLVVIMSLQIGAHAVSTLLPQLLQLIKGKRGIYIAWLEAMSYILCVVDGQSGAHE